MGRRTKTIFRLLIAVTLILFGMQLELPYFYTKPGSAIDLAPIIEVENGYRTEQGHLMMTTVSIDRTNVWDYLYAKVNSDIDLVKQEQVKAHGETDEEYFKRQRDNMVASQQKAIVVAFRKAGVPIDIEEQGAIIRFFIEGMPAEKVLKSGDRITAIEDKAIRTSDQVIQAFKGKKSGDIVPMTVIRDKETLHVEVEVVPFPEQYQTTPGEVRVGIGILSPETKLEIKTSKEVKFHTQDIGGPSAGLMFTLEMINQLTPEDITKGHKIAGTGTMDLDGKVGPIGGARHKVVAAAEEGAEIFFAPNSGSPISNYEEALQSATKKGLKIKVVPVSTIDDALDYLSQLPR